MKKTNTHHSLVIYSFAGLSVALGVGIVVAGSHLSDVVAYIVNQSPASAVLVTDTNKKVSSDLHNHIEKQTLKTITKVMSDDGARTDRRHVKHKARKKIIS